MENSNNNFGKVLVGLLAGAALGAVAGLLFAPEEGSKTRGKIAKKAKKIADDVQTTAHDVKEKVVHEANRLRNNLENKANDAEERVQDMAHSVKQTSESFKH